jgi:hypothetical protein
MNRSLELILLILVTGLFPTSASERPQGERADIQHAIVYREEGRFAAWPANLGIWSWSEEILVGFVEAAHREGAGFHAYDQSTARHRFARSRDGGLTWEHEDAYQRGQTAWTYTNRLSEGAEKPVEPTVAIDFTHPDLALTFLRETNDIGPSLFYYSYDRGQRWRGPFRLPDLGTPGIATRTNYIVEGPHELLAFFTVAKANRKEGRVLAARTGDGGKTWERVSWIGPEPEGFEIMPASVRLENTELLTVIRRREASGQDLLSSYSSDDNGRTWKRLADPVSDTGYGGSPPALTRLRDGRLALAYTVRSDDGSRLSLKYSSDGGRTWSDEIVLRRDGATSDSGYPRMVQRRDGKLVVAYYWNHELQEHEEPWRFIAATILDPS